MPERPFHVCRVSKKSHSRGGQSVSVRTVVQVAVVRGQRLLTALSMLSENNDSDSFLNAQSMRGT